MTSNPPVEAFDCPSCKAVLMPPVCCCGRPHELIVQCPDCAWRGVRIVTRAHQTTTTPTL